MIKTVIVNNYLGDELVLSLTGSHEEHGLYIKSITGIGPGKATINTTDLASDDGGIYNSARAEIRNIVITLGMYQSTIHRNSIEDARQLTYQYFPLKKSVLLTFITDNRALYIEGYVESNDPDIFSEEESTQISIICPDPNFYNAVGDNRVSFGSVDDLFEFPGDEKYHIGDEVDGIIVTREGEDPRWHPETGYQNNSLTENLTEFGTIVVATNKTIVYSGEVETGFTLHIHPKSNMTSFGVYNVDTGEKIEIDDTVIQKITGSGILAGDEITICTVKGQKSAYLMRAGVTYNIINALGKNPDWLQFHISAYGNSDNVFAFNATTGSDNIDGYISFNEAFQGV